MAPWQREYPITIKNCCFYKLRLFKKIYYYKLVTEAQKHNTIIVYLLIF